MATSQSFFSDVVYLPLSTAAANTVGGRHHARTAQNTRSTSAFDDVPEGTSVQKGKSSHRTDARRASWLAKRRKRMACGFSRDWSATRSSWMSRPRSDTDSGKLSFNKKGANTVQLRDILSIVVEVPFAPIVKRFDGVTLVGAVSENIVTRRGKPIRIERLGRPEIKNFVLENTTHDPHTKGVELRDLYNKEDAFALSKEYRPLYESRLDANLAFFDGLDGKTAWPLGPDGRHPLRDLLIGDFLILDLAHAFAPGNFLRSNGRYSMTNRTKAPAVAGSMTTFSTRC